MTVDVYKKNTHNVILDHVRTNAFDEWISKNVKDKVVCDLGAGSGILCYLAYIYGARKVYGIECQTKCLKNLKVIFKDYPIEIIEGDVFEMDYPECDIYLHELFASNFVGEGVMKMVENANRQGVGDKLFPNKINLYEGHTELKNGIIVEHTGYLNKNPRDFFLFSGQRSFNLKMWEYYSVKHNTVYEGLIKDLDMSNLRYKKGSIILWDAEIVSNYLDWSHWQPKYKWGSIDGTT